MGQCLPEAKEVISSSITSAFVTQTPVLPGCDCKRENHSTGLNISSGSVGNISSLSSLPVFSEGATWQFQSQSLPDFHQKQPVFKSQHTPLSSFWFPEPEKSKFFQNLAAPSPLRPPSSFIDSIIESSNICTEEKTKDERTTKSHLTSDCGPNSVKEKPQLKGWTLIRLSPLARWELEGHIAWKVCTLREQTVPLAVRDSWAMLNYLIEVQRVPESENPHSQSSMPIHQKTEQNINNKSPDFPGLSSPETKTSQPLIQSKQPQPGDGPQILGSRPLVTSRDNLPPRNMGVKKIEEETTLLQKQPKYMLDFGRVEPRVVDLPEKSVFQQQKTQETDVAFTAKLPYQVTERTKVTPLALLQVMDSMGMIPESHTEVMKSMNLFPRPPNQVVKPMEAKEKANAIPEPPNQVIESRAVTPKLQHQGMASEGWTSRSLNQVTGNVKVTPVAFLQVMDPIGMTNQPHPHITGSGRFTTGSQCHVEESVKVDHQVIKSETVCPMPEHAVLGTVAMTGQPQHKVIESVGIASSPQSDVTESSKITPGSIPQNTKSLEIPPRPLYQVLDDRKVTPVTLLQAMDIMGLTRPAQPQISSLTPRPTKPDSLTSSCSLPTIIAPCKVVEPVDRPPRPPTKIMESVEVIPKPPHQAIGSPIAVGSPMGLMTGPQSPIVEAKGLTPSLISQVTNSLESTPKSWIKELESVGTTPQSHHQDLDFVALSSGPPQQVMGPLRFTPQQHPIPEYSKIGLKQNHQSTEMLGLTSDKWLQMRGSDKPPQSHHRIVESLGTIPRSLSQGKESMGMSQKPLQQVTESAVMSTASFLQDVNSMRVKPIPQFKAKECTKLFPGLQRVKPENLTLGPRFQSVKSLDLATGSVSQMIKYGRLTSAVESTGLAPELQQQSVKSEAVFPAQQLQSGLSGQSVPRPQLQDEQSVQLPLAPQLQCVKSTKLAPASQSQNKKSVDLGPKSQSQGMECIHLTMPPETVELTLRPVTQNIQSVELAPKPHLQDIRSETIAPKLMPKDVKTMELTPQMVECRSSASEVCPQEKEPVKLIPKQVMQSAGTAPVPHPQIFSEMISGPDCADTETGLTSEAFPQMAFTEKPTGQLGDSVKMTPQPPLQVTEAPEINLKPRYEDPEIVGLTFLEVGKTQRMAPGSLDLEKGSLELTPGSRMQDEKSEPLRQALKYVELTPEPSPLVVGSENLAIGPKPHTMELSPESLLQGVKSRQLDPEQQSQDVKCGNLTKQLTTSKEEAELTPGKVSEKRTKRTQSESVKSGDLILDQGQQRVKSSGLTQGPQPQNFRFSVLTPGPLLQGEKCVDFVSGPPHHAMKFAELIPGSPMQEINWSDFTPGPPNQPLKAIHLTPELQDTKFEVLLPEPCLKNVKFSDLTPEPKDKSFKYGQLMPGSQLQDVKPPVLGPESSLQLSHEPQVADRKSVPSTPGSLFHSMKSVKLTKEQQFQGMKSEELNLGKQQQDVTFPELTPGPKLQSVKCGVEIPGPGLHSANSVEVMSELGLQDPIFTQTSAGFQGIKQIGLSPGPCLQNVRVFDLSPGTQPQGTKSSELSSGPQLHCVKISQLPTEAKTQGAQSVDLLPAPERQGDKPEMLVLEGLKYVELNQLPIVNKLVSEPHSKLARRSQFQGIKTSKLTQEPQVKDAEPLEWTLGSKFQGLNSEESTLEPQIRGDKYVEIISGPQVKDAKFVKFTSGSKLQGVKSVELIPGSKTQKCKTVELLLDSQLQEVKSVDLNLTSKTQGKNSMAFPPESLIQAIAKSMEVLQKPLFKGVRPEELTLEPKMQDTKFVETSPSLKLQSSQSVEVNQDPKLQCVKSAKGTPRLKMEVVKSVNETVRQEFQGVKALDLSSRQRFQGTTGVDLTAEPEQDGKTSVMVTPDQQCAHLEHLKRESGSEGMASVELIPEPKFKDVKLVDLNAELKLKNMRSFELPPEPNIQGIKAKAQSQNIKSPQLTTGPPQLPQMKSLETTSRPQLQDQKTEVSNQKPELRNMKCVLPVPECQDEGSVDFIPGVQSLGVEMAELKQLRDGSLKSAQWIPGSEVQGRKSEVLSIGSQFQDVKPATLKPMVKLRDVLSSEMILGGTKLSDEKFMESHLESGWQLKKIPELFPGLQLQKGKKMEPHSKSQLQSVKVVQLNQEPELGSMKSAQWIPGPEFQCRKSVGLSIGSQSHGVKPGQLKPALQLRAVKSSELTLGSKLQDEESMEFNSEPQQPIWKTLNLSPELQMQNGTHPLQEPELMDLTPVIGVQGSKSLELTPDTSCQVPDTMDLHSQPWPQFKSFGVLYTKPLQEVAESEGITLEPKYRTAETMGLTYEARLQRKEPLRIAPNPISQDIEHTKGSRRPSFQALEPVEMIPKKRLKREESVILIPKSLHHVQESPGVTLGPGHQVIESVELPSETWTQVRDHRDLTSKSWNHMGSSGSVSENQVAESARTQLQVSKSIGVTPVAHPKVVDSVEVTPGPLFEVVKSEAFTSRPTLQMVDSVELPSKPQYMSRSAFTSGLWLQNVNSKGLITTQEPTHQLLETSEFTGFQIVKTVLLPGSLIQIVKSELAPGLIPQLVEPKIVQRTQLEEIGNLDLPARPHLQERVEPVELTPRPNIQVKPGELISLPTFTLEKPIVLTPEPEVQAVKSTGIKTESPQVMESEDLHLGQVYQNRKSKELMSAELQVGNYLSKFIHSSSSARISRPIKTMSEKGSSWGSKMPQGSKDLDSWKNSELEAFQPGEPDEAPITTQSSVRPVNLPNPSSSQTAITVETPHPEVPRVDVISQEKTKRKQIEGTDNSLQSPSQHPSRSRRLSSEIPQAVSGVRRGLTRPILGRQQNVWESRACKQRLPRKYLSNMAKLGNILGATVEKKGCLQTFLAEEATADPCKSIQKLFGIPAELMNPPQGLLEKDHSIVFHSSVVKNYVQRHTSCHGPEKRKTLRIWTRGFPSSIIQQYLGTRVGLEKTNSRFSDTSQEVKQHMPFSYTKDQIPAPVKSDSSHRIFCTQMNYFPIEESENSQSDSQTRTLEDQYTFGSSYLPQAKSDFSEQSRQLQDLQLKIAAKLLRSQLPPNVPPPFATGLVLKYPICLQCGRCSGFACCHKSQNPCGPYLIIYPQLHLVNTPEGHGGIRLHLGFRLRTGKRPQVPKYHGRDKPVTTKSPLSPSQRKAKINTQAIKSPTPTTDVWSGLSQTPTPVQAPIRQDQYGRPDPAGKTEIGECGHYELIQVHSLPESSTESIQEEKWAELHLQKTHNTKYLMRKLTKEVRPQSSGSLIESPSRELPVRLRRKRLGAAQATTASLKRKPKPSSHPSFMHLLFQSFKQAFQIAHRVVVSTGQKLENRERSDKLGLGKNSCLKQKARDQGLFRESQGEGKPDIKIRPTDPTTKLGRTNQFRSDQQPKRETLFQSRSTQLSTQLSKSTVSSKGACQTTSIPESQIHSSSGDKQSYKRASSSQQPKNLAKPGTRVEARGQTRQGSSRKTSTSSRFQEKPPHKEQDRQSGPSQRSPHSLSERSRHSSAKGTGLGVPKNRHHRASERSPRSPSERRRHILSEGGHRSPSERRHILSEESHRSPSERRHILFEGSHQSPSERGHRSPSERRRRILSDRGHRSPSEKSPGSHSKRTPQKPSERSHRSHSEKPQRSPSEKTPSDPAAREPGTVPLREAQTALRRESSTMPPGRGQGAECPKMS
ncbi:spermatogenesis-associated protein 31H1 [Tenrec ecaudatus]|uniref:spermatogenesis-associated protein 31H1 n=1 Tax=Tenrec ecaudatus TaxID=94439 RepID=UPI003F5A1D83